MVFKIKKTIAWFLIVVMLFQLSAFDQSFASEVSSPPEPEITYYAQSTWGGSYPEVGNSHLYLEVRGNNLSTLSNIKANLYKKPDDATYVASSTESIYLGVNRDSEDVYIFKLEFEQDKTLEASDYYVEIVDDENNDMLPSGKAHLLTLDSYISPVWVEISISEMADNLDSVYLEAKARNFKLGETKDAFTMELVQGDVYDRWEPSGNISKVGSIIADTFVLDELEDGIYSLKGKFSLSSSMDPAIPVFVRVIGPGKSGTTETSYNWYGISVLSTASPVMKNLEISNSYTVMAHGHGESDNEDLGTYYVNANEDTLNFSFHSTAMSNPSKIDLKLKSNETLVGELMSLKSDLQENGLFKVYGTVGSTVCESVYGAVYNISSRENYDLEIYYDSALIGKGTVLSTTVKGAEGISYEGSFSHLSYTYPVYNKDSIEIVVEKTLNMDSSLFSGNLINVDDPSDIITLNITAEAIDNNIALRLTPTVEPSGTYRLDLKHDGEDIYQLSAYMGELEATSPILLYNPITFHFTDDNRSELKSIDNQNNTLYLTGKRFSASKSYVSYFVKHIGSSLASAPFAIPSAVSGSNKLTITKEAQASLPRGWYTVYVKEDGQYVKGLADVALLSDAASSSAILPTVQINNDEKYTLVPDITIKITPGSFSQVKIASSQENLESSPWQDISSEISYTLEGGFGVKTIYFLFRTSSGFEYALSGSITYRGDFLTDMVSYGILGTSMDNGTAYLHNKGSYTFYIQGDNRDLTGYVEFLNDNDEIIRIETLKRTSGANLVHTYSKQIAISDALLPTKTIRFYVKDKFDYTSKAETIAVDVNEEAFISSYQSKLKTKLLDEQYILQGSEITFIIKGTPTFSSSVTIHYIDIDGNPQTTAVLLNETDNSGQYQGSTPLSKDIGRITKFVYTLEDSNNSDNKAISEEAKDLDVTGSAKFTGLSNSDGDYNGKILSVSNIRNWTTEEIFIKDEESVFTIEGLQPYILYNYRLWDDNKTYKLGNFTIDKGKTETIHLGDAAQPAKVKMNLANLDPEDRDQVKLYYNIPYFPYKRYIEPGENISGLIVGDDLIYGIELSDGAARKYKAVIEKTSSIQNKNMEINLNMELLDTIHLNGTIMDERIANQALDKVNVNIKQYVHNGSHTFTYITNAVTDENGQYSAKVYPDSQIEISFSKPGYITKNQNLTISQNHKLDKTLELSTQNRLVVQPYARPILNPGEEADDSQLLALDMYKIRTLTLESVDGKRIYAPFYRQTGYVDLTYIEGYENKDIKVIVTFFDQQTEEEYYMVKLDAYKNGVIKPIAVPNGELVADVVTSNGNAPYAYMLLYDKNGQQAVYMESPGTITTKQMKIEAGNYLALFFKGFDLERLKEYKTWDSFELLELNENIEFIKKNVTISDGRIASLGEIDIPEMLMPDKLGTSTTRISTRFIPNSSSGELRVLAQISHDLGDDKTFNYVTLKTNGTLKPDSVYFDGTHYSGSPYSIATGDGRKTENTMYFTIIPSSVEQTYLSLDLVYRMGDSRVSETISLDNLNVPKVTLIAPEEVLMGLDAKEVLVRGVSTAGSKIEIYANDQLIGEVVTPMNKTSYQTTVELPNSSTSMVHLLYAKMITDEEEITTGYSICEVIDPSVMAYTSNFTFRNNSDFRAFSLDSPSESSYPLTLSYNPNYTSEISFRINNLLKDELDYVAFVNTYNGVDNYFEAEHIKDVYNANYKYSEWKVDKKIGMPGEFSVYYSLADSASLGPISGTKPIDFEEAIKNPVIDPAYIPTSILESDGRKVTQVGETLSIVVPVSDTGYLKLDGSFKENQYVSVDDLLSEGYVQINTLQGPYWTKESLEEIDGVTVYNRKIYFSPQLTAILKNESSSPQVYKFLGGPLLAQAQASQFDIQPLSTVDQALSVADYTGYVYNIADFTAHSGGNASGFGIGSKMQVLGGAVFVAQALSGPTSKDHNTLYEAAALIKDPMIRSRIGDDIRQYDKARRSAHTVSTILGGASYGAGFGGLVGKGLSYIISTGSMVYGKKTGAELDIWWDAIMRDIQNEINLQEFRKKKGKKKPAKKDKMKKPKWKIDPSGYVFEAIDSNRIEGITAFALLGDMDSENSFVIWDDAEEWEEINPDITDKDGKYGWDVPEGDWKVKFVGNDNYKTSYTQAMAVPPLHDQVNIGLLSKRVPGVLAVALDHGGLEIEFDSYMQLESIYDKESSINNIFIYDSSNNPVPCEKVEMIIGTKDTVYKETDDNVYQADYIQSENFVKRVRFVIDELLCPGGFKEFKDDGETKETYRVVISGNVQSYSGIRMDREYEEGSLEVKEKPTMAVPVSSIPAGTYYSSREVDFTSAVTGGTIYYTTDGSEPTTLSRVWSESMNIDKSTTIRLLASKVGYYDSDIQSFEYRIEKEPMDIAAKPTANVAGGTYSSPVTVSLSTATEDSTIRYTLDGSIPSISSTLYTKPIQINESKTLRAVAMKNNYVNSSVADFHYTIKSSGLDPGATPVNQSSAAKSSTITYSEDNRTLQIELAANNQNIYSLSNEDVNQLISTIKSKPTDTIVLKVDKAGINVKQIYQLPIQFMREVSGLTKAIKVQSSEFQLIINQATLKELSNLRETNFILEVTKEKSNQLSISIMKDKNTMKLGEGKLIVAMAHSIPGHQWVLVENENTSGRNLLSYSAYSNGYVWGSVKGSAILSLINNIKPFEDISGGWYEDAVAFVTSRELFRGTSDDSFSPNLPMTRGMLATVLFKLSKSETPAIPVRDHKQFVDVPDTEYYYDSINWAYEVGVLSGIENDQFAPSSNITREQLAVMLYNYCKAHNMLIPVQGSGSETFSDSNSISDWAVTAVDYAVRSGLMGGKENNILDPKGNATRAEVAVMLKNYIEMNRHYPR